MENEWEIESLKGIGTNSDGKEFYIIKWKGDIDFTFNRMEDENVASAVQAFETSRASSKDALEMPQTIRKTKKGAKSKRTNVSSTVSNGAQIIPNKAKGSNSSTLPDAQLMDGVLENETALAIDHVIFNKPIPKSNREAPLIGNNESVEGEENISNPMNESPDHNSNYVDEHSMDVGTEKVDHEIEPNNSLQQKKVKRSPNRKHIERETRPNLKIAIPDDDRQINDNTASSSIQLDDANATKNKSNEKNIAKKKQRTQAVGRRKKITLTKRPTPEELAIDDELAADKDDELYIIENILSHRLTNGVCMFLIQWKDYGNEFNSWEPDANIPAQLVSKYFLNRLPKKS